MVLGNASVLFYVQFYGEEKRLPEWMPNGVVEAFSAVMNKIPIDFEFPLHFFIKLQKFIKFLISIR